MTSQIRVDEITNRSGLGTVTIYDNGFEFTGVTTFTEDVDITGGLTIGGVLTYEDVTNIDSVGVITARAGINISGGNLQVGGTNVINSGRVLYNLEQIKLADAKELVLGSGNDLKIQHSGSHSFISQEGVGALKIKGDDIRFEDAGGTEAVRLTSGGNLLVGRTADYWSSRSIFQEDKDGRTQVLIKNDNNHASASSCISLNAWGNSWVIDAGSNSKNSNALTFGVDASIATPTEKLRLTTTGLMGLGCNPETDFQVRNGNGGTIKIGGSGTDATGLTLSYNNSGSTTTTIKQHYRATSSSALLHVDTGTLTVATGTTNVERLRVTSGGDVVIGHTSASRGPLHIHKSSADCYFHMTNSTSGTGASNGFTIHQSGDDTLLNNRQTGHLRLYTSGTERLRIQSDGNVIPASNDAYNLGLNGNRWNKVWTNYVRHGTRSATYEKTFTATSNGSGNLTFECGVLWLNDDSSFEVLCHIDRTGSYNSIAARYKFYGSKVSGFGTQNTYRSDTGTYYIISPMSNPTIDAYTPSGQGSSHGTRIAHTGAAANAEYRLTMLIKWVGQREVT